MRHCSALTALSIPEVKTKGWKRPDGGARGLLQPCGQFGEGTSSPVSAAREAGPGITRNS